MEFIEIKNGISKDKLLELIANKVQELVAEYGELIARVERVTTAYHDLRERLDNHISKHKEYEGGGRPVPK